MIEFGQILLLVTVIYLTVVLSVRAMLGQYTAVVAMMTATLVTCVLLLAYSLS